MDQRGTLDRVVMIFAFAPGATNTDRTAAHQRWTLPMARPARFMAKRQ